MSLLTWSIAATTGLIVVVFVVQAMTRVARTRGVVLDEMRRFLRGGVMERVPGRGDQVRGRLGELEVTVDLCSDPKRASQSPMWRIMAVGPVAADFAAEAHVAGWSGWIDPWMRMGKSITIPGAVGPSFSVHADEPMTLEHGVVGALRRQGPTLGPGGLHVRRDFMRAEVRFDPRPEGNRSLFAFLQAMAEISERKPARSLAAPARVRTRAREVS